MMGSAPGSKIFKAIFGFAEYCKLLPIRGDPSSIFLYTFNVTLAIVTTILNVLHLIQNIRYKSNRLVHIAFEDLCQELALLSFIYLELMFVFNKKAIYEHVRRIEDFKAFGKDEQLIVKDKRLAGTIKTLTLVLPLVMPAFGAAKFFLHDCDVRNPCRELVNFWMPVSHESVFVAFVYPLIQVLNLSYISMSLLCIQLTVELSKQLLIMRLEHLNRILLKVHFDKSDKCNLKLKMCITYHDCLLSLHREHTKCFSLMTIVPYFGSSIVMSLSLVTLSVKVSFTSIMTTGLWTTSLVIQSYFAQKLLDVGAKLRETAYDLNWYEGSVASQKNLLLFLLKLQVPLKTRMSGIGEMSYENMRQLLARCYSYLAIFLKMK